MSSENENPNTASAEDQPPAEDRMELEDRCCRRGRRGFWIVPLILIAVLAKAGVIMLLWNYLMPELFHAPELSYVQALGLMILAKFLVGFGHGFGHFRRHRHHHGLRRHWRMKRDLWKGMSDEERQKLRQEMRKRWNC